MKFKDRLDAAMQLAPRLEKYRTENGVVLAVPRGGVPIGFYIAKYLDFPLELLMAKKLGHPMHPEYAIGAVTLEDSIVEETFDLPPEYLETEVKQIRQRLQKRYTKFRGNRKPMDLKGKTCIVVDDGIATGRTILSTIKILRKKLPERIVVAVPAAPFETARKIRETVDDLVCLETPTMFYGVGAFYEDFSQVEDEEVVALLGDLNGKRMAA